jgi:hypothetical protein
MKKQYHTAEVTSVQTASRRGVGWCVLLALFFAVSACKSREEAYTAEVIEKIYQPAKSSTGVGYGFSGGKGGGGPIIVTDNQPEQWILILRVDGEVVSEKVDAETWAAAKAGEPLNLTRTVWE